MTEVETVTSLSASLLQKIHAAIKCLCQIMLNQKLVCKFEKWCKFLSRVQVKSHKKKLRKTRNACIPFWQHIPNILINEPSR